MFVWESEHESKRRLNYRELRRKKIAQKKNVIKTSILVNFLSSQIESKALSKGKKNNTKNEILFLTHCLISISRYDLLPTSIRAVLILYEPNVDNQHKSKGPMHFFVNLTAVAAQKAQRKNTNKWNEEIEQNMRQSDNCS